jgi:Ca2+-binding EF-hand superfamily protein
VCAGSHDLDANEVAHLKAQFEVFDADGSGEIEAAEFINICLKLGLSERTAVALVAEIDDDQDGKISLEEYMSHDVVNHLTEAVRKKKSESDKLVADKEMRTHVNVGRIVDIVRAKLDNSALAFSFLRHLAFMVLYTFIVIQQRAPKDSMYGPSPISFADLFLWQQTLCVGSHCFAVYHALHAGLVKQKARFTHFDSSFLSQQGDASSASQLFRRFIIPFAQYLRTEVLVRLARKMAGVCMRLRKRVPFEGAQLQNFCIVAQMRPHVLPD